MSFFDARISVFSVEYDVKEGLKFDEHLKKHKLLSFVMAIHLFANGLHEIYPVVNSINAVRSCKFNYVLKFIMYLFPIQRLLLIVGLKANHFRFLCCMPTCNKPILFQFTI